MQIEQIYRKSVRIIDLPFISCYVYYMNPGKADTKHFHDGIEIEYVIKGNSKTHKQGRFYFRKSGEIHEGVNDSKEELVFLDITIPSESEKNTYHLE